MRPQSYFHRIVLGYQPARWRDRIVIFGSPPFIAATKRALRMIRSAQGVECDVKAVFFDQVFTIRQRWRAGGYMIMRDRELLVTENEWCLPTIGYAAELVREAYRSWRSTALDPGEDDVDVEGDCLSFSEEALRQFKAPEQLARAITRKVISDTFAYFSRSYKHRKSECLGLPRHPLGMIRLYQRRMRRNWQQLVITGCARFIENTQQALELLATTDCGSEIFDNLKFIKEASRPMRWAACIYSDPDNPKVIVASDYGEQTNPIKYAETLAHEACHNMIQRQNEKRSRADEERECFRYEARVAHELGASPEHWGYLERNATQPIWGLDPPEAFWQWLQLDDASQTSQP